MVKKMNVSFADKKKRAFVKSSTKQQRYIFENILRLSLRKKEKKFNKNECFKITLENIASSGERTRIKWEIKDERLFVAIKDETLKRLNFEKRRDALYLFESHSTLQKGRG